MRAVRGPHLYPDTGSSAASGEQLTQPVVVLFEKGVMTAREEDEALLEVDDVLPDVEEEERSRAGRAPSTLSNRG
jgi:hypothetical protein